MTECSSISPPMVSAPDTTVTLKQLGGVKALLRNPGLILSTLRHGALAGQDEIGNQFYVSRADGRKRRWCVFASGVDASSVGPEWHAWLHGLTDAPLPDTDRQPWWKPHQPNLTGTGGGYRPAGHDYAGGKRAAAAADYESWSPEL